MGSKWSKNSFSGYILPLLMTGFDLFSMFFFPTLWAKDLLKEFIYWLFSSIPIVLLSSIICIMKRVTIFKKHLLVAASVSDCDQEF